MKSVVCDPFLVQLELGSLSFMRSSTAFQSYHWKSPLTERPFRVDDHTQIFHGDF